MLFVSQSRSEEQNQPNNYAGLYSQGLDLPDYVVQSYNPNRGDLILNATELREQITMFNDGTVSPWLQSAADALGFTPRQVLQQQRAAQENSSSFDVIQFPNSAPTYPDQSSSSSSSTSTNSSKVDITTTVGGAQSLMGRGFPVRGAAWISGNIQQESGWDGQRDWGEVAGDGSDRNGGIVSWMDGVQHNNFRLTRIEEHLGKSIIEANDQEQIDAMIWEMKTFYPEAHAIFMNPHASDRDLIRASRLYWGYVRS